MDDFERPSEAFMLWLKTEQSASVSDKIQLADLRSQGAGRGVGPSVVFFPLALLSDIYQLPART